MKNLILCLLLIASASTVTAQSAADLPSASPAMRAGEDAEKKGHRLLDEMYAALGGDTWAKRGTVYFEGRTALFFQGQPTGALNSFVGWKKLPAPGSPELVRFEFISGRGMITPGTKRDLVHLWTADNGYEKGYKGSTPLPKEQVEEHMRRRAHTLEEVFNTMLKLPGTLVVAEGQGMRDRRAVDKVSIITANNDTVDIEIEQNTHLPIERSFEWRNPLFKDHDVDEEVYGDWRIIQGAATPMNTTIYKNGDMVSQTFYKKFKYGDPIDAKLFDPQAPFLKK